VKPNINSLEVHPQLSNNWHPSGGWYTGSSFWEERWMQKPAQFSFTFSRKINNNNTLCQTFFFFLSFFFFFSGKKDDDNNKSVVGRF
jgi:hypothetical protein